MIFGILTEQDDPRVASAPATVKKMIAAGHVVMVQSGAGDRAFYSDQDFIDAGAEIVSSGKILTEAEVIVSHEPISSALMKELKAGTILISMFSPRSNPEVKSAFEASNLWAFSMDMIPRTSIAQSMDVLSSTASLAGYRAVLVAAAQLPGYFPMLMTAAGTIPPAKVLILGAGVAGLQAIATSRRLGAKVEVFDVRAAVKEEVESLGAKFIEVAGAQEDQAAGGYAITQTEEYQRKQRDLIHEHASKSDVIITTANIPGRKAPILIEQRTVEAMRKGSVIIDLAAATGGNCALTQNDQTVVHHDVSIIGNSLLAAGMSRDASLLYSNNVWSFVQYVFKDGKDKVDFSNDIVSSTFLGKVPQTA
ncbi:MAG: NAD(P) transhydrogenase subunit alpha [Bacteroidia bacterium]|nr:NAD(P) transhydrogenase subunit alpha [Bacteroidia bacterium]